MLNTLINRKQLFFENENNECKTWRDELDNSLVYIRNCNHSLFTIECRKIEKLIIENCDDITLDIKCGVRTSTLELFKSSNLRLNLLNEHCGVQMVVLDDCSTCSLMIPYDKVLENLSLFHSESCNQLTVNQTPVIYESEDEAENESLDIEPVHPRMQVIGNQFKSYWNPMKNQIVSELVLREGSSAYVTTKTEIRKR